MRIIAGEKQRTPLRCPRGLETRPTLERVRESLFMTLEPRLAGARVLDLYAGAGTLGLEALSRGAAEAVFVESGASALKALRANIDKLRWASRTRVSKAKVLAFLSRPRGSARFDFVVADPPYGRGWMPLVLAKLSSRPEAWLNPEATVVAQVGRRDQLEPTHGPLRRVWTRDYGETRVDIFQFETEAQIKD